MDQQLEASTLGMWVFLVTEIMFFGGLFMAYILYRYWYPDAWAAASNHLNVPLGALNTAVLIFSSLTMALAVRSAQVGSRRGQIVNLIADDHRSARRSWSSSTSSTRRSSSITWCPAVLRSPDSTTSTTTRRRPPEQLFFSLYFIMTGIHAAAHGGRHRPDARSFWRWRGRAVRPDVLQPGRSLRPLLALRRHRLDLPVPAAVPARRASGRGALRTHEPSCPIVAHAPRTSSLRSATYVVVFVALFVATVLTYLVATQDFGWLNTPIALGIAVAKASLVVIYFMGVRYNTPLTKVVVVAGFFWLLILFGLTMSDYVSRPWIGVPGR